MLIAVLLFLAAAEIDSLMRRLIRRTGDPFYQEHPHLRNERMKSFESSFRMSLLSRSRGDGGRKAVDGADLNST